uniref:Uncharacterized protein n=1 Tax=Arundo donax TaxID=35708 RepID=A0A0A9CAU6_ARUDO
MIILLRKPCLMLLSLAKKSTRKRGVSFKVVIVTRAEIVAVKSQSA